MTTPHQYHHVRNPYAKSTSSFHSYTKNASSLRKDDAEMSGDFRESNSRASNNTLDMYEDQLSNISNARQSHINSSNEANIQNQEGHGYSNNMNESRLIQHHRTMEESSHQYNNKNSHSYQTTLHHPPTQSIVSDNNPELQNKLKSLSMQLELKCEETFDLNATLAAVEAESAHNIKTTQAQAQEQIRQMQEQLRRSEMERNKVTAMLAEEKKKRKELSVSISQQQNNGSHFPLEQTFEKNKSRFSLPAVTPTTGNSKLLNNSFQKKNNESRLDRNGLKNKEPLQVPMLAARSQASGSNIPLCRTTNMTQGDLSTLRFSIPQSKYPNDNQLGEMILNDHPYLMNFTEVSIHNEHKVQISNTTKSQIVNKTLSNSKRKRNQYIQTQNESETISKHSNEENVLNPTIKEQFHSNIFSAETQSVLFSFVKSMVSCPTEINPNQQHKTTSLMRLVLHILVSRHLPYFANFDSKKWMPICKETLFLFRLLYKIISSSIFARNEMAHWIEAISDRMGSRSTTTKKPGHLRDGRLRHNFDVATSQIEQQNPQYLWQTESDSEFRFVMNKFVSFMEILVFFIGVQKKDEGQQNLNSIRFIQCEVLRILSLLIQGNERLIRIFYTKFLFLDNLVLKIQEIETAQQTTDINLVFSLEKAMKLSSNNSIAFKLHVIRFVSMLLSNAPPDLNISADTKKKIIDIGTCYLRKWISKSLHSSPDSPWRQSNDDHKALEIVLEIIHTFHVICSVWENGVTMLLHIYPPVDKGNETKCSPKSFDSAIATLVETFSCITTSLFNSSIDTYALEIIHKWKQLLSNIVALFVCIANHTQNLRQMYEEKDVEVNEWVSFLSVIVERKDMFCACCHLICHYDEAHGEKVGNADMADERLIRELSMMLEEIACDEDELEELRTS